MTITLRSQNFKSALSHLILVLLLNGISAPAMADSISSIARQTKTVESVFVGKFVKTGDYVLQDGSKNPYELYIPIRILKGPPCGSGEIRVSISSPKAPSSKPNPRVGSLWIVCVLFNDVGLWEPEDHCVGTIEYSKKSLDYVLKALLKKSKDLSYNSALRAEVYADIDEFISNHR